MYLMSWTLVSAKSKRPSSKQATDWNPDLIRSLTLIARLAFWGYLFAIKDFPGEK